MPQDSLQEKLNREMYQVWPDASRSGVTSLLAVSGGPDSVALARLVADSRPPGSRVYLAHFNHGLRGEESDADEKWVGEFAAELQMESIMGRSDVPAPESNRGEGLEALARKSRYDFLTESAKRVGARYVVTAHTRDDQVETMIHRLFRGSGLRGLNGIPTLRPLVDGITLVRPLLGVSKDELLQFLSSLNQGYRSDSSNLSAEFTRNRIRRELIPLVNDIFAKPVAAGLESLRQHVGEACRMLEPLVDRVLSEAVDVQPERAMVRLGKNRDSLSPFLLNEVLVKIWIQQDWPRQQMNKARWDSISALAAAVEGTKINLPGNLMAERIPQGIAIWAVVAG
ncbi:MAG: tRNA lysidine(34) synthetase TilS [Planctomycetota bacterium]|nr:tRNA lysidine(34) synthetase TilS [Planctomycetota bacterium]